MKKIIWLLLFLSVFALFKIGYFSIDLSKSQAQTTVISPSPIPSPIANASPSESPIKNLDADELWSLAQSWRQSQKLQPYIKDQRLCTIAKDRADDPQPDYHKGFIEKYSNYPYAIQENVVFGYATERDSLDGWLNSPPHRTTLEKSYIYSCITCYKQVCAQIFSNF